MCALREPASRACVACETVPLPDTDVFPLNTIKGSAKVPVGPFEAEHPKRYQIRFFNPQKVRQARFLFIWESPGGGEGGCIGDCANQKSVNTLIGAGEGGCIGDCANHKSVNTVTVKCQLSTCQSDTRRHRNKNTPKLITITGLLLAFLC